MILDATVSVEARVMTIVKSAFYYLVRKLVPYLSTYNMATIIHTMVTSKLKYCNLLYPGLPLGLTQ